MPYAEEDWEDPEQRDVPKNTNPDLSLTMQTRHSGRGRAEKKCTPYGDNFIVHRIDLKRKAEDLTASQEADIVDEQDNEWFDARSKQEE